MIVSDYNRWNDRQDEFVKHKILDANGDIYLMGASIIGHFKGYKSGHGLNHALLHVLLAQEDAWEYVTFDDKKKSPVTFLQQLAHADI